MSKVAFVRAVLVRSLPKLARADAAIDYGEALWERLTARGYGQKSPSQPRESIDYYARLNGTVKASFDRFWRAFARKGDDKQGAAMRWGQLAESGELNAELIERIIKAAAAEAALPRGEGEVRCMARRWLFERRWEGYAEGRANDRTAERATEIRKLYGDLAHLKGMRETMPYDGLEAQIEKLEQQIRDLRRAP